MLLSSDAINAASERLSPEDFSSPVYACIYDAMIALSSAGHPVDPVTVADELKRNENLDRVGRMEILTELQDATPSTINATSYIDIVSDLSKLRKLITAASEIADVAYKAPKDVSKAIDQAEGIIFKVTQTRNTDSMAGAVDELDAITDRLERLFSGEVTGLPTGFNDLDAIVPNLQPGALYIVGGRPAMGKTAWALNVAEHASIGLHVPTLVFSLEMGQQELLMRMACSQARIDHKRFQLGDITDREWSRLNHAYARIADAPLWIDDNASSTIMEIRSKARLLKSRVGELGLIVVDYLQLMEGASRDGRQVEVSQISRGLKVLARELECPVIALSQLSRKLEERSDKRPMPSDLRESGSLEQDADVIFFLYRDEEYNPDSDDKGLAEVLVAKHRNGPTGMAKLAYLAPFTRFETAAK